MPGFAERPREGTGQQSGYRHPFSWRGEAPGVSQGR